MNKMKIFNISVFLFIFIIISITNSQWKKVSDIPYPNNYWLDVFFLESDPNYGWVCGFNGYIIKTTDGGNTWEPRSIIGAYQLESIHFVSTLVGYSSGIVADLYNTGRIYKTTDGGDSWADITPNNAGSLWGNYFIDANNGIVVGGGCGDQQNFFRTSNGGYSWVQFSDNFADAGLSDVILSTNDSVGWASSSGVLWKTTDGGWSWKPYRRSGGSDWQEELAHFGNSFLLPFSNGCTGWEAAGGMRFSTDNGDNWKETIVSENMFGSFLINAISGWACGRGPTIYYTSDAGNSWELKNCGIDPRDSLDDVWFINDTLGWVVGSGVYKTARLDTLHPVIEAYPDTSICSGDTVILKTNRNYKYYYWSNDETTPEIHVTKAGEYWVKVQNSMCDSGVSEKIFVEFYPKPSLKINNGSIPTACQGDTAFLWVNGKFESILWSTGETTDTIAITKDGEYSVFVVDSNSCTSSDKINIKFNKKPEPIITASTKTNICIGDSVVLTCNPVFNQYFWYLKENNILIDENKKSISIKESGIYYVLVIDENGCIGISNEIEVTVSLDSNRFYIELSNNNYDTLFIDSTKLTKNNCSKVKIFNKGGEDKLLNNIFLYRNIEFSIPQSQFPILIPAYSSIELSICYSPTLLGEQKDTILLLDNCSNHLLPIISYGSSNYYYGNGKCDLRFEIQSFKLTNFLFSVSPPYPNPTDGLTTISYIKFLPNNEQATETCSIYNMFGQELLSLENKILSKRTTQFGEIIEGEFHLNTMELSSGSYFIIIKNKLSTDVFPLIINK